MSLKISSFCTPECQSFIFRNACFPVLVDLATYQCLKNYAHAPIYSTLAGFFTLAAITYQSPLPLLGGAIYIAYKATSYVVSRLSSTPTEAWDDLKIAVALNTVLSAIEESKTNLEPIYTNPSSSAATLTKDLGNATLAEILNADIHTLATFVEVLLKKMNPPLLTSVKDRFEAAASLEAQQKKVSLSFALQDLSTTRREIFERLIRHLNKILLLKENPVHAAADLGQIFSRLFVVAPSEPFIQVITYLINNPKILE